MLAWSCEAGTVDVVGWGDCGMVVEVERHYKHDRVRRCGAG